jgi:hypothetical protein
MCTNNGGLDDPRMNPGLEDLCERVLILRLFECCGKELLREIEE